MRFLALIVLLALSSNAVAANCVASDVDSSIKYCVGDDVYHIDSWTLRVTPAKLVGFNTFVSGKVEGIVEVYHISEVATETVNLDTQIAVNYGCSSRYNVCVGDFAQDRWSYVEYKILGRLADGRAVGGLCFGDRAKCSEKFPDVLGDSLIPWN